MSDIDSRILDALKLKFSFKKTGGAWLQEGTCPECNERSIYCAAEQPKIARCGRQNSCGAEWTMRELFPDIFEDWSKRAPKTPDNPNATADAYLQHERGFDLQHLRGCYSQEWFQDQDLGVGSATVRFPLGPDAWWERIIDRPGRFEKKANFKPKGKWRGHAWIPPHLTWEALATADEIRMVEGIFDSLSMVSAGLVAVSCMTVNVWPEYFFDQLREAIRNGPSPKHKPTIVWAFDVGAAGVTWTKKFVARAAKEGWESTADQVRPDGEGTKLDWNDLWLRQLSSKEPVKGEDDYRPFSAKMLEEYRYNGKVTIARTPEEKADLIQSRSKGRSFWMRFDNRLYWCKFEAEEDGPGEFRPSPISNCAFRILYRERDENIDETNYFLQIDFPNRPGTENKRPSEKARFSSSACATSSEFKKRLMAFAGMWTGSGEQLDRIMAAQTSDLKTVRPLHFTGYSPQDKAWVLGEIAVREGRLVKVNSEKYFDFGKAAVKLQTAERMLDISYNQDKLNIEWLQHVYTAWGPKGLLAVAFFSMSFFAVQIREKHKSLGFLEVTGLPGSGKTTLIEFCWKLCGRTGYEGFDPNKGTLAFTARNFMKVSGLPVGLIESGRADDKRSSHGRQFDYNELLTLYNGRNPRGLGAKSSGTETFEPPFLGSIYLMQNHRIDAMDAVLERLMSFDIDKANWSDETTKSAIAIENWPIEQVSGFVVHAVRREAEYLKAFFSRFDHHNASMAKRVAETAKGRELHNSRAIKCHSQLAAAVDALTTLVKLPDQWVDDTIRLIDMMAFDRQQSSGADHPVVAKFWEQVDFLIAREDNDSHAKGVSINQHRKPDEYYAIQLAAFESRARNVGLVPPTYEELKRHLKSSRVRKYVDAKPVNNPAGKFAHCWVFSKPSSAPALPI